MSVPITPEADLLKRPASDSGTGSGAPASDPAEDAQVWRRTGRERMMRALLGQPLSLVGLTLLALLLLSAVAAPLLAPHSPLDTDIGRQFIGLFSHRSFPLGTDDVGRDMLSRALYGARLSFLAVAVVLGAAVPFGVALGMLGAYWGGRIDSALMRLTDIFLAFPSLVLALAVGSILGPSEWNAMWAVAVVWWPWYTRLARGQVLGVKGDLYIEAARAMGVGHAGILWRHVLPQILAPVVILATLDVGNVVLTISGLSFIGLGAQPPTPELGAMVAGGRQYMLTSWWIPTIPGATIFAIVLATNLLGDGIRDMLDPRGKG